VSRSDSVLVDKSAIVSEFATIKGSSRGSKIIIGANTHVYDFVVLSSVGGAGNIVIGENCHINPHTTLYSGNGIKLGNYVLIGPGCSLVPTNHAFGNLDEVMRKQGFLSSKGGVIIEDDVWVGANSVLLDGTYLEKGSVIAAHSTVNSRVPAYEIWGTLGGIATKIGDRRTRTSNS
jgi:virginiamycin A acetyltransferase